MRYKVTPRKLRTLAADLRAAKWVRANAEVTDDAVLMRRFLAIHDWFVANALRPSRDVFAGLDHRYLFEIVKRWMKLYDRTVVELAHRFPLRDGDRRLVLDGVDWSALLGVRFEGLFWIEIPSRYAEFWAERSTKERDVFASYEARTAFVGSAADRMYFDLMQADELLVVDEFTNAVPSFDLEQALVGAPSGASLSTIAAAHGWHVVEFARGAHERLTAHLTAAA